VINKDAIAGCQKSLLKLCLVCFEVKQRQTRMSDRLEIPGVVNVFLLIQITKIDIDETEFIYSHLLLLIV
jgi:hypothetical protein